VSLCIFLEGQIQAFTQQHLFPFDGYDYAIMRREIKVCSGLACANIGGWFHDLDMSSYLTEACLHNETLFDESTLWIIFISVEISASFLATVSSSLCFIITGGGHNRSVVYGCYEPKPLFAIPSSSFLVY
jgi:hypothetical protein